ncbi:MAG TPA: helix-turn-helix transcriptional regulator [Cellvibrio sp.]|nr:helix-turn-helix transcriptional regulator [Cellvibrio sp.]
MPKPLANDIDRQIGLRLKKLRQQEGISAATLAEAIGCTQQQISRYENAQNKISASQLYLLANTLAVPLSWFFLESETTPSMISEKPPQPYSTHPRSDDAATLQAIWPRLKPIQRNALLKLLDSFLD